MNIKIKNCDVNIITDTKTLEISGKTVELYRKCEDEVSAEHPFYCLCGKIATGLHEMCYAKFRQAVSADIAK